MAHAADILISSKRPMAEPLAGLSRLAADTDLFIIDLWGVVHGGVEPFPGVVETLQALRAADKRVVFVSNAPVRSRHIARHLEEMGLGRAYDALLTSGEMTWRHMTTRYAEKRYHGIGPSWARLLHDDLPHAAAGLDEADLLLVVGLADGKARAEEHHVELEAARARDLPLVCANPDRVIVVQDGTYSVCAGALADLYVDLGGKVDWLGKPEPEIFRDAAASVGIEDPSGVVVVGDGLPTDIQGAAAFGCRSVLVTRGIHARDLGLVAGEEAPAEALEAVLAAHPARPDFVMATLRW